MSVRVPAVALHHSIYIYSLLSISGSNPNLIPIPAALVIVVIVIVYSDALAEFVHPFAARACGMNLNLSGIVETNSKFILVHHSRWRSHDARRAPLWKHHKYMRLQMRATLTLFENSPRAPQTDSRRAFWIACVYQSTYTECCQMF